LGYRAVHELEARRIMLEMSREPGLPTDTSHVAMDVREGVKLVLIVHKSPIIALGIQSIVSENYAGCHFIRLSRADRLDQILQRSKAESAAIAMVRIIVDVTSIGPVQVQELISEAASSRVEDVRCLLFNDISRVVPAKPGKNVILAPDLLAASSCPKWERTIGKLMGMALSKGAKSIVSKQTLQGAPACHTTAPITRKQADVLELVLLGHTNKQIALRLGLAESTVKAYVGLLMAQFKVVRRTELIARSGKWQRTGN
jgi:DNA-binding CsgD family transcriptional regulator